jgi:flavin-dependent dehydrogenase
LPGVEVLEEAPACEVEEREDRVLVRCGSVVHAGRVVVGADGVNSVVSRCLPGHDQRTIGFAYEGEARFETPELKDEVLFDFRSFPSGYGWIFPKLDHYSVGGYVFDGGVKKVAELYDSFCAGSRRLRACATYRRRGYRIPHGGQARRLNGARVMLAGDAGDLVDPLSGEGIYYALRSGQLAAESALEFLAGNASLDRYGDRVGSEIQGELRYARKLADIVLRHPRAAFFLLLKNRTVCRWNIEILSGRRKYSSLRGELRRAWLLPLQFRPAARLRVQVELG